MFTQETTEFVPRKIAGKEIPRLMKEVLVTRNFIRHKSCGNIFWIEDKLLLSKIKKGLTLCPYYNTKHK